MPWLTPGWRLPCGLCPKYSRKCHRSVSSVSPAQPAPVRSADQRKHDQHAIPHARRSDREPRANSTTSTTKHATKINMSAPTRSALPTVPHARETKIN